MEYTKSYTGSDFSADVTLNYTAFNFLTLHLASLQTGLDSGGFRTWRWRASGRAAILRSTSRRRRARDRDFAGRYRNGWLSARSHRLRPRLQDRVCRRYRPGPSVQRYRCVGGGGIMFLDFELGDNPALSSRAPLLVGEHCETGAAPVRTRLTLRRRPASRPVGGTPSSWPSRRWVAA